MKKLAKAAFAFVLTWVVVVNMFAATTHAQRILDSGAYLGWELKTPLYVGYAVGISADFAFNISAGTIIYREIPHEFLFTGRSRRHLASGGWRQEKAEYWCAQLELFDEGHCDE